jgi:ABC-type lipoprotein release transport system permease subunit
VFHFYFRLRGLGHVSRVFLCIMIAGLLFTLRGTVIGIVVDWVIKRIRIIITRLRPFG